MTEETANPSPTLLPQEPAAQAPGADYRVLARKYRPQTFAELIGQEAMVRTLRNAIEAGRLAHAFILTGVRGVGKTTTARIIARALNCIGADGQGGVTIAACGVCENCRAIAEDRHMDVLEMDAASRTGVDDIRELIDGVRYRPTSARYKVYIIDEVHMLSRNAFNALLKTLEEPPEHVKFIFATTEVRKVPVTVLSRCQRFDLRRIDVETLASHFAQLAEKEGALVSVPALHLIARAADGSVRDGLSLLDQAIAQGSDGIDEDQVRRMLGLADRTMTFDLFEGVMKGEIAAALELLAAQYEAGANPTQVLEDMLDLVHWLTRVKVVPQAADDPGVPEAERVRGKALADGLSMAALSRAWQMMLKGLQEVAMAPSPMQAAEMVLVRMAYASDLPAPAEAIEALRRGDGPPAGPPSSGESSAATGAPASSVAAPARSEGAPWDDGGAPRAMATRSSPMLKAEAALAPDVQPMLEEPVPDETVPAKPDPASFVEVVALAEALREALLHSALRNNVHLVHFEPGRIEFKPDEHAPRDLANELSRVLNEATDRRWVVTVSSEAGAQTLRQQAEAADAVAHARAQDHPLVKAALDTFPGARITSVRPLAPSADDAPQGGEDGLPVDPDEAADDD
jgi:DNA polymerase-3 subunit gamma/tau